MVYAVAAAWADEVEMLPGQYLEQVRGNAVAALLLAISDTLVDAVECRLKLKAAERTAPRNFALQLITIVSDWPPVRSTPKLRLASRREALASMPGRRVHVDRRVRQTASGAVYR